LPYSDPDKQRKAAREWARKNRKNTNSHRRTAAAKLRARVAALKHNKPCTDCGERYPYYVMDFDHTCDNKSESIGRLVGRYAPWKEIEEEIKKCDLVCANCHRERTQQRLNTPLLVDSSPDPAKVG